MSTTTPSDAGLSPPHDAPFRRFVVQHHLDGPGGSHFDLMFETDGALATWRSAVPLSAVTDLPVAITRIGDHRLAYLDYQGAVSDDRGRVEIVDAGVYEPIIVQPDEWRIAVSGRMARGQYHLHVENGSLWTIRHGAE